MHVYVINNTINGKLYVGQHAGEDLEAYWRHNVSAALRNRGNKLFLYRAIRKYGPKFFSIRSIYIPVDLADMNRAEIAYIRFFGTQNEELGYNITAGGGGRLGISRPHTEKEKLRIGLVHKGKLVSQETRERMSAAQNGRSITNEHKQALIGSHGGPHKQKRSPEHCEKIRQNKLKQWAERKQQAI